jgi:hypothetical protein
MEWRLINHVLFFRVSLFLQFYCFWLIFGKATEMHAASSSYGATGKPILFNDKSHDVNKTVG